MSTPAIKINHDLSMAPLSALPINGLEQLKAAAIAGQTASRLLPQGYQVEHLFQLSGKAVIFLYSPPTPGKIVHAATPPNPVPMPPEMAHGRIQIGNETWYLSAKGNATVLQKVMEIRASLNGNSYELISHIECKLIHRRFWSTNWKKACGNGTFYNDKIYPLLSAYISKIIKPHAKIIELCGGDGTLASQILAKHQISKLTLVDFDPSSCEKAAKKLADLPARVIEASITTVDYGTEPVDIVYGSGALTQYVLASKQEALKALNKVTAVLKKEGYLLLSGLTQSWVTAEDLRARGYKVLNMFDPQHLVQMYVAQKL